MIEKISDNGGVFKRHYSEKGGHLQRHICWQLEKRWDRLNPNFPIHPRVLSPQPVPITEEWRIRRCMPRYGKRDGR